MGSPVPTEPLPDAGRDHSDYPITSDFAEEAGLEQIDTAHHAQKRAVHRTGATHLTAPLQSARMVLQE